MTEQNSTRGPSDSTGIFRVVAECPQLLDKHAAFLAAGGDRLIRALQDTLIQGMWPWDRPSDQAAQFGAFCAGVGYAARILLQLGALVNNRRALGELVKSANIPVAEQGELKRILIKDYGYTEADFKEQQTTGG